MKIFSVSQIRQADDFTIKNEPIASIDLMERAAHRCFLWFTKNIEINTSIALFCGLGNNGGDGLALARMLVITGYKVDVYLVKHSQNQSADCLMNQHLLMKNSIPINKIFSLDELPIIHARVVVDALVGTGLNKPISGILAKTILWLNKQSGLKISIDIPSGLFADRNLQNRMDAIFKADHTLSFQFPKLSFLFPKYGEFSGYFHVLDIKLSKEYIQQTPTINYFVDADFIAEILPKRGKWNHKGTFGHAILVAGSRGKMGAAILASRAALKSGAGLVTAYVPQIGLDSVQTANPEVMVTTDIGIDALEDIKLTQNISAVGIGPGIGQSEKTQQAVLKFIAEAKMPLVLDADAINILAQNKAWKVLQNKCILTPHLGELSRLLGVEVSGEEMYDLARTFAMKHQVILLVKGAHTAIYTPKGDVFFNSTGTHGMATAGSGDVLTGIITGLLAQGISPENAAIIGAYFHGKAGEKGAEFLGNRGLLASDLIAHLKLEHN